MQPYFPAGAVALVEPGHAHKEFVQKAKPRFAMMKYHHANRLLKAGETAESWFPDETKVITTTNIIDSRNVAIPLEDNGYRNGEVEIVKQFKPDYHIPADRADYIDFSDDKRFEKVKECMKGTITMKKHIEDDGLDTQIIPFLKTATPRERSLCYQTIEYLGLDYAAVYCNPYFNGKGGVQIAELINDLEMLASESRDKFGDTDDPLRLFTISCLSPNVLAEMPDCVVAGSGQMVGTDRGWRDSITPTKQTEAEVKSIFADVESRAADALGVDVDLDRYTENESATEKPSQPDQPVRGES